MAYTQQAFDYVTGLTVANRLQINNNYLVVANPPPRDYRFEGKTGGSGFTELFGQHDTLVYRATCSA
ncbi:MAG: hypothetical protein VB140_09515 [Burkholderia sp.]